MIKIFAISGNGIGAGKSTLAKKLGQEIWSLAGALRDELKHDYPAYDWYNKSQEYKANTRVKEEGKRTVREVMIERGQVRCAEDALYWVRKLADKLEYVEKMATGLKTVAIDDVRKISEIECLKERFPGQVVHFHLLTSTAVREPMFENDELCEVADYTIRFE